MLLMLDLLAERYGQLPSAIVRNADTLDITVMTAAINHANELNQAAGRTNYIPKYKQPTQDQLQAMLDLAKQGAKDATKSSQ